jgi:hypothetical protein
MASADPSKKPSPTDPYKKPTPTLNDYAAWVLARLAEERGEVGSTVAGWIIDRWVVDNTEFLAREYRITRDGYHAQRSRERRDGKGVGGGED